MEEQLQKAKDKLKGLKIFVTGGCGFVGSNLVKRLVGFGCEVKVFDIMVPPQGSLGVEYVEGDIRDYNAVYTAMKGADMVFHLSAILGVEKIINKPFEVLDINLLGTKYALLAARDLNVKRFIYTSSSEVYGDPRKLPISEEDPKAPVSVYGISKLAGEAYCEAFTSEFGLKTTIVRYFNVYGPGQKEKFIVPIFISRIVNNLPPIIYGHGEQSRCYTYVDDAVNGTILAAAYDKVDTALFNIGNDEETSVEELAYYLIKLSGKQMDIERKKFGDGIRVEQREIMHRKPDVYKAKALLGFKISVPWQEGVKRFMAWYTSNNVK